MKKIMFTFDSETLRYLLGQIKEQIDKKVSIEQYAIKAEPTDADAFVVGSDIEIDHPLIVKLINEKGISIVNGDKVLIKNKVLSEANYSQEEKDALKEIIDGGGIDAILNTRLDGLNLEVVTQEEYDALLNSEAGLEPDKLYIVTDKEFTVFEIDNYSTRKEVQAISDLKVDKVSYTNQAGETVEKVLSQKDFTEAHAAIVDFIIEKGGVNGLVLQSEIVDNLESDEANKALSARQGKVIREEYLADKKHVYLTQAEYNALETFENNVIYHIKDAETLYGLTEEQMNHLKHAYEHSLIDLSQTYASKSEVYQARRTTDGRFYKSLQERLFALDQTADELFYNLSNFENINESLDIYGVHVDFEEQEITRLGCAQGKQGGDDFNACFPWAGMRRCNLLNGEVVAYEGDNTYIEDGSNGDVMVEIPKFYYKVIPVRTEPADTEEGLQLVEAEWYISPYDLPTFKIHPAFVRNGEVVNSIYVGAYESCIYSTNKNNYITGNVNNRMDIDFNADKLVSLANVMPCSGLLISDFTNLSINKGQGYKQIDFTTWSAIQLLFVIEYASFNVQEKLGDGCYNLYSNTNSDNGVKYRSIENLWTNFWHFVEGISLCKNDRFLYWSNDINFNNIDTTCFKINFKNLATSSQQESLFPNRFGYDQNNDFCFIPVGKNGASNLMPHDAYYPMYTGISAEFVPMRMGGCSFDELQNNGLFTTYTRQDASYTSARYGARLMFHR